VRRHFLVALLYFQFELALDRRHLESCLPAPGRLGRHDPEIHVLPDAGLAVRRPVAEIEVVRHDARAGLQG
jgi:hypothetical protein